MRIMYVSSGVCSSDLVVVIFAVDDRIGTRFAELGLFERADVGRVGGFGNRLGEACGDLVAVEAVCRTPDAVDYGGVRGLEAVGNAGDLIEGGEMEHCALRGNEEGGR